MSRILIAVALICFVVNAWALKHSREAVLRPFVQGKALKIISGLNNFDNNPYVRLLYAWIETLNEKYNNHGFHHIAEFEDTSYYIHTWITHKPSYYFPILVGEKGP
jgi:hypothetical protein